MAIEYKDGEKFKALAPILENYIHWFGVIALHVAYPEEHDAKLPEPSSFETWVDKERQNGQINPNILFNIVDIYENMMIEGRKIIQVLDNRDKPSIDEFKSFKNFYTTFLTRIRRMERDSAMEGSGIDEETGLRIPKALESDMKRELERLERQGAAFCLVMFRIDRFAGVQDQKNTLKMAVDNIKKCMRPFDDAYYMGQGQFILSLKQTDIIGAEAGVNRLRLFMEEDRDNMEKSTMSFCMVEPTVGDQADEMINNMKQDLDTNLNARDAVLKFKEISELERYLGANE